MNKLDMVRAAIAKLRTRVGVYDVHRSGLLRTVDAMPFDDYRAVGIGHVLILWPRKDKL